jgi:hypothetical protein
MHLLPLGFSFTSTSFVYVHASVDVFTRTSFLPFSTEMPTHEPHRDDDVTPRSLHSTSSRLVHSNQGRIKLKYRFFIIKKRNATGGAILLIYWDLFCFRLLNFLNIEQVSYILFFTHLKEHRLLNCACRHSRTRQMM